MFLVTIFKINLKYLLVEIYRINYFSIKSLWKELDKFCRIRLLWGNHLSNRVRNSLTVFWFVFSLQNLLECCCHMSLNIKPIKNSTKGIHSHYWRPTARLAARDSFLPVLVTPGIYYWEIQMAPRPLFSLTVLLEIVLFPASATFAYWR
jgi:hypothetical protein